LLPRLIHPRPFAADRSILVIAAREPAEIGGGVEPCHTDAALHHPVLAELCQEAVGMVRGDFHIGLVGLHLDGADLVLGDIAIAADGRDQPAWLAALLAADREREPDGRAEIAARCERPRCRITRLAVARLA